MTTDPRRAWQDRSKCAKSELLHGLSCAIRLPSLITRSATNFFAGIFCLASMLLFLLHGCISKHTTDKLQEDRKQNVVIIFTDDMGYGDISTYGQTHHSTPNIDRLASQGVKCTDFYVPVPYCAPSRATLLTGRFPLRHQLTRNPSPDTGVDSVGISSDEVLLGEVLQSEGYATKLVGKWHLGHLKNYFPTKHGFDEYYGILYSNDMRPVQIIEDMDTVEYPVDQRLLTKKYTEQAVDFIRRKRNEPFFLHVCHPMPHKPLAASAEFYTPNTPGDLYDDVIRELDWSVGQIMKALDELELAEHTIVLFLSDNGPSWGGSSGGFKGMKGTNWEGGTRVPFIIRGKGVPQNTTITTPCWSPDIFPTLLAMLDIDVPSDLILDGENIYDVLTSSRATHNPIFTMRGDRTMTIRYGKWKLFLNEPKYYNGVNPKYLISWESRNPDGETIIAPLEQYHPRNYPGEKPLDFDTFPLLFNLEEDPGETTNLADQHPDIVNDLQTAFSDFINSLEED